MRTTLTLDPSVYAAALEVAKRSRRSLGDVVSEWALRGLEASRPSSRLREEGLEDFPVFETPAGTPPITNAHVQSLLEEEGL